MPQNPPLLSLAKSYNCKKIYNCATVLSNFYDGIVATSDGGWVFLIIFYEEEERERVGEINILMNRWGK